MYRQRLLNDLDAVPNSLEVVYFVYQYGVVRIQSPSPIEFIIHRANKKFIFSDHASKKETTWAYATSIANESELLTIVKKIASSEEYGNYLGFYTLKPETKLPEFRPAENILPSEAIEQLKLGVDSVMSGNWKAK